ncbi:hypothetical protein ABH944_006005 [Caballeronia udeis]|uniref:Purine nucleoside phosphorylase n=1 Tax=Caballeronia udeis TaxID=1232866 RepID=A0ABW8MTQ1_9BURK
MNKSLVPAMVLACALGAPAFAYAQDADTVSRPAVKADLVQMEQSGYNVEGDHTTYPVQAQAAEQRVEANRGVTATSYGSPTDGSSAAGMRMPMAQPDGTHSVYFGH